MEIAEFLLARIAEDEAVARRARERNLPFWVAQAMGRSGGDLGPDYVRQFSPTRTLAECIAKRAILDIASPGGDVAAIAAEMRAEGAYPGEVMAIVEPIAAAFEQAVDHSMEVVLKCLALPYQDHPDYRPEWKTI